MEPIHPEARLPLPGSVTTTDINYITSTKAAVLYARDIGLYATKCTRETADYINGLWAEESAGK